ncbi:flavodoxin domain-containing protein [Tsukamurella sp. 8F]|uniref:flavodoxin domain-containing protein n=1 Tax=unclassified Tsukamurella TaxID=2633480 RepID=UPI0023BA1121|nr:MULTISPECIES: flavodoxin domain-containing protein [unclassified Tsukamurella]MDF0531318.1 flavodoxin domain-containing protein [Tsukamurella sp. 8J]MDF0588524.1 flavodoxin domain-containing protein [Tsukamurella sp. 8F]
MSVHIFYGSSTGTAEGAANSMVEVFEKQGPVEVHDMMDGETDALDPGSFHVFVCATYGEGELPAGAEYFFETLGDEEPDLAGLRFAVFGLGDTIYDDTYNAAGKIITAKITELGGERVGERAEHDNSGEDDPEETAVEWAQGILPLI